MELRTNHTNSARLKRGFIVYEQAHKQFTGNNSTFATMVMQPGTSIAQVNTMLEQWLEEVSKMVGTGRHGIHVFGAAFSLSAGGHKWPHLHIAVRTAKSRKSGMTISKLPQEAKEHLCQCWEALAGKPATGQACSLETIFGMGELVGYLAGPRNAGCPGQEMHIISH